MVPFIALIAANHVRFIGCPANAVQLGWLVGDDGWVLLIEGGFGVLITIDVLSH